MGRTPGYVDFLLFHVVEGLRVAKAVASPERDYPLVADRARVAAFPTLQRDFKSKQALDFNEDDLLQHYAELDLQ